MKEHDLVQHTINGFRKRLSTPDIMLQIKHEIIEADFITQDTKAILGLDLKKTFDNTTYTPIFDNIGLKALGVGKKHLIEPQKWC